MLALVWNWREIFRAGDGELATDPNSITVGGDIKMNLDLNEAIEEDVKLSEEATNWICVFAPSHNRMVCQKLVIAYVKLYWAWYCSLSCSFTAEIKLEKTICDFQTFIIRGQKLFYMALLNIIWLGQMTNKDKSIVNLDV